MFQNLFKNEELSIQRDDSIKFKDVALCVLEKNGFKSSTINLDKTLESDQLPFSTLLSYNDRVYFTRFIFSRNFQIPYSVLAEEGNKLKYHNQIIDDNPVIGQNVTYDYLLIIGASVSDPQRKALKRVGVEICDISNLLYLVEDNEEDKESLISLLSYSTQTVVPEPFRLLSNKVFKAPLIRLQYALINKLISWDSKEHNSSEYEELCTKVVKFLFSDELSLWKEQKRSNDNMYRFDLICKIKDGQISGFWQAIEKFFNSKYVIFEYKNYKDQITQREIYTTDRYLYKKALRCVAIIISCNGADNNAQRAIRGTLRENGKLIISLDNKELIKMLQVKDSKGIPSDYLYDKLDEMLIDLEK